MVPVLVPQVPRIDRCNYKTRYCDAASGLVVFVLGSIPGGGGAGSVLDRQLPPKVWEQSAADMGGSPSVQH